MLHLVDDIIWHLGFTAISEAQNTLRVTSQIIAYCEYCNDCALFHVRIENNIPESAWVEKHRNSKRDT